MSYSSYELTKTLVIDHYTLKRLTKHIPHSLTNFSINGKKVTAFLFSESDFNELVEPIIRKYGSDYKNKKSIVEAIKSTLGISLFLPELGEADTKIRRRKMRGFAASH